MNSKKRVLLLIGSPRQQASTSLSLGTYLIEKMQAQGFESQTIFLHKSFKTEGRTKVLLDVVNQVDFIVIAFPLYLDCLPYSVIKMMEIVAQNRRNRKISMTQRLVCIVNNGFPEPHQTDTAIAICMQFAKEAGFDWAGSLKLGGGEAIQGRPLNKVKGMARNVIKSLNIAATALSLGDPVPQDAKALMAKKMVPYFIYRWLGKMHWKRDAKKHEVHKKMDSRPFQHP